MKNSAILHNVLPCYEHFSRSTICSTYHPVGEAQLEVTRVHLILWGGQEAWVFHVKEFFDAQHDSVPTRLPEQLLLITQRHAEAQVRGRTTARKALVNNTDAASSPRILYKASLFWEDWCTYQTSNNISRCTFVVCWYKIIFIYYFADCLLDLNALLAVTKTWHINYSSFTGHRDK